MLVVGKKVKLPTYLACLNCWRCGTTASADSFGWSSQRLQRGHVVCSGRLLDIFVQDTVVGHRLPCVHCSRICSQRTTWFGNGITLNSDRSFDDCCALRGAGVLCRSRSRLWQLLCYSICGLIWRLFCGKSGDQVAVLFGNGIDRDRTWPWDCSCAWSRILLGNWYSLGQLLCRSVWRLTWWLFCRKSKTLSRRLGLCLQRACSCYLLRSNLCVRDREPLSRIHEIKCWLS